MCCATLSLLWPGWPGVPLLGDCPPFLIHNPPSCQKFRGDDFAHFVGGVRKVQVIIPKSRKFQWSDQFSLELFACSAIFFRISIKSSFYVQIVADGIVFRRRCKFLSELSPAALFYVKIFRLRRYFTFKSLYESQFCAENSPAALHIMHFFLCLGTPCWFCGCHPPPEKNS